MYYINYHTGARKANAETIEEAKRIADEGAIYTQEIITVEDESGKVLWQRAWVETGYTWEEYAEEFDVKEEDLMIFGTSGFYAEWQNVEDWQ